MDYKPYELTGIYQDSPAPTELLAPYDLHAAYDESAGGDEQYVGASGFDSLVISQPHLIFIQNININGFACADYGMPITSNKNKEIKPLGVDAFSTGNPPTVYNLRQYIECSGFESSSYGTAYMQGGVKSIDILAFDSNTFGTAKLINTKADQFANLNDQGISSPLIPNPNVSPRIFYPIGVRSDGYGQPLIQRSPAPDGFTTDSYGNPWVSHNPRYVIPIGINSFNTGYARIYDPTQTIYIADRGLEGGIFGDIRLHNKNQFIGTSGFDNQQFSDFTTAYSNLRTLQTKGFDSLVFSENTIHNKTPSIAPQGFDSLSGLAPSVGYAIRYVYPTGFDLLKSGIATLTKPPTISPIGFDMLRLGTQFISNAIRTLEVVGKDSLAISEPIVWFRYRHLTPDSFASATYGNPRIEHGRRALLAQGANSAAFGNNAWLSYAVRQLVPESIYKEFASNHLVGGLQYINGQGFVATEFGTRIIPESQTVYAQGFSNSFGLTSIDLKTNYIKPNGFLTAGQEGGQRFGSAKFWNKRQYILQFYDVDSGLVPPKWIGWTGIENRNKVIGVIGHDTGYVASPAIENKARPVWPAGFDAVIIFKSMIADRIRYLKPQGLEPPYIGSWAVVYNDARVIAVQGFNGLSIGNPSTEKTRRHYERVGNFDSLAMGTPMIADRIRTLGIESRYGIVPPSIPLPRVDLYTRYIEEVGRFDDYQALGSPSLSIHWNIVAPRWALRDAYGYPVVKNLTPEIPVFGHDSQAFGVSFARTQWRELLQQGSETVAWGKTEIAFRDRQFAVSSFNAGAIGDKLKVIKTGTPPYYPQYIWLDIVEMDGKEQPGYGIAPLQKQVSMPALKTNVIQTEGFIATQYGSHATQSNGILAQPGLQELNVGEPAVGLKNRTMQVGGINSAIEVGKPGLSPHTIYAVIDAPEQARQNHKTSGSPHYVNSDGGQRTPGEVFGAINISLQHRTLQISIGNAGSIGNGHTIVLKKRYVDLKDFGFRSQRMGFHVVGPFDQTIIQFESDESMLFGSPYLSTPNIGAHYLKPAGLDALAYHNPIIEPLHRTLKVSGFDHQAFGNNASPDNPFMWQGMRVGERVLGIYGGHESQVFGDTFVSLKFREVQAVGFDSFVCEYDYTAFDQRMRVTGQQIPKPVKSIAPIGFDDLAYGVPNIRPAAHYIRPDGNADQYRKGAW